MRKILKLYQSIFCISLFVGLSSCQETNPDASNDISKENLNAIPITKNASYTLKFLGENLGINNFSGSLSKLADGVHHHSGIGVVTQNTLDGIKAKMINTFQNTLPINYSGIIFYLNDFYSSISSQNIKGLSIFIPAGDYYEHRFYQVKNNIILEDVELRFLMNAYTSQDLKILLFKSTQEYLTPSSWLFIKNSELSFRDNGNPRIYLTKILMEKTNMLLSMEGGDRCGGPCIRDVGGCNGELCDFCYFEDVEEKANASGVYINPTLYSESRARTFRDNFMINSKLGKKYIGYYYAFSHAALGINLLRNDNIQDVLNLGIDLYDIAEKLQFGSDSEIIVKVGFKNSAVKFLIDCKKQTSNQEFLNMMDEIINDINRFEGKSKTYILNNLN